MNIQNPKEVVVSPELGKEEDALLSYWTKERMDAAQPLPLPVLTEPIDNTHVLTSLQGPLVSGDSRLPGGETFRADVKNECK